MLAKGRKKRASVEPFTSVDQLRTWVRDNLDLVIPTARVCPDHDPPMEYLRRAYFEHGGDLVVWAPRGGGKTRLAAAATLLDLLHKPNCAIRILGGSLEQSLRMWEHLCPDLERLAEDQIQGKLLARKIHLKNGSSAAVLTQSQRAVRGLRIQKLRCDEVEMFDPEVWEAAQLVTRSQRSAEGGIVRGAIEAISTWHRPWGVMQKIVENAHASGVPVIKWCLMEVLERCHPDRICDDCPLLDECGGVAKTRCDGFFSIDDAIAMKQRVGRDTWDAEMLCRRPVTTGRVFGMFSRDLHVRESIDDLAKGGRDDKGELWLGIDFGFSAAFACLWIRAYADGRVHVIDEHIHRAMTMEAHIREIQSRPWGKVKAIACDPAGNGPNGQTGKSDVDLLRQAGFSVRFHSSQIVDGLGIIRGKLQPACGEPRLYIHPRCTQLIRALEAYHYKDDTSEKPVKDGSDHPVDALRYFYINYRRGEAKAGRY